MPSRTNPTSLAHTKPRTIREAYCPRGPNFSLSGSPGSSLEPVVGPVARIGGDEGDREGMSENVAGVRRMPVRIDEGRGANQVGRWNSRTGRFVSMRSGGDTEVRSSHEADEGQTSGDPFEQLRYFDDEFEQHIRDSSMTTIMLERQLHSPPQTDRPSTRGLQAARGSYDRPPPSLFLVDLSPSYARGLGGLQPGQAEDDGRRIAFGGERIATKPPTYDPGWERLPRYSPVTPRGRYGRYGLYENQGDPDGEQSYLLASDPEMGMLAWPPWMPLPRSDQDREGEDNRDRHGRLTDTGAMWLNVFLVLSCLAVWTLVIISLKFQSDGRGNGTIPVGGGGGGAGQPPIGWYPGAGMGGYANVRGVGSASMGEEMNRRRGPITDEGVWR